MITKPVRILVHEVHDGLGGVYYRGAIVEFESTLAEFLRSRGQCEIVDRETLKQAAVDAKAQIAERAAAQLKSEAAARMRVYDALPAEIRAAAAEHGDQVIDEYLRPDEPLQQILDAAEPQKRKRGRPRKSAPG